MLKNLIINCNLAIPISASTHYVNIQAIPKHMIVGVQPHKAQTRNRVLHVLR